LVAGDVLEVDAISVGEALVELGTVPALEDLHDAFNDPVLLFLGLASLGFGLDHRQRLMVILVHLADLVKQVKNLDLPGRFALPAAQVKDSVRRIVSNRRRLGRGGVRFVFLSRRTLRYRFHLTECVLLPRWVLRSH
jgi:hypothetical protein